MAIQLSASMSKKIPIAGIDYASQHASITVTSEITDLTQITQEAARLFAAAEAVVDRQLGISAADISRPMAEPTSNTPITSPSAPATRQSRRGPAPITDSQLRLLDRLLGEHPDQRQVVFARCNVTDLRHCTCKQASEAIDQLKALPR